MAGNLLEKEVTAAHVADAFVALALSERTTGHVVTVDGRNVGPNCAEAAVGHRFPPSPPGFISACDRP